MCESKGEALADGLVEEVSLAQASLLHDPAALTRCCRYHGRCSVLALVSVWLCVCCAALSCRLC